MQKKSNFENFQSALYLTSGSMPLTQSGHLSVKAIEFPSPISAIQYQNGLLSLNSIHGSNYIV